MKVEFTGRQTEVTPKVRGLAERKLKKLARVLPGITHVHVVLSSDKHRRIAEVTVQSRHLTLTAAEQTDDHVASLGTVMDKLARQAQRHVGRRRERKRREPEGAALAPSGPAAGGDGGVRIIKSRRADVKPMTVDEAALEVDASQEGFLVFRDAATEKVSVLFKRKDGNFGLTEA